MPASLTGLVNLCWRFCGDILSENDIVSVFLGLFSASPLKMLQWLACRIKKLYYSSIWMIQIHNHFCSDRKKTTHLLYCGSTMTLETAVADKTKNKWPAFFSLDATTKNNKYLSLRFHSATVLYYKILFLFNVSLSSFLNRPHQIIRVFYASLCWL